MISFTAALSMCAFVGIVCACISAKLTGDSARNEINRILESRASGCQSHSNALLGHRRRERK